MNNDKAAVLETIIGLLTDGLSSSRAKDMEAFARHYLRRIPEDELASRDEPDWCALINGHFQMLSKRTVGTTEVRIFNPNENEHGWSSGFTVIEIVTDDKPFLVDSTTMAVNDLGLAIHLIIHPVYRSIRDQGGYLMDLAPLTGSLANSKTESVMHFEVDLVTQPSKLSKIRKRVEQYLGDVTRAVSDWPQMLTQLKDAKAQLLAAKTPYSEQVVNEAAEFIGWLADNHFTILGYREYQIVREGKRPLLKRLGDSGLGILRDEAEGEDLVPIPSEDPFDLSKSTPMLITKTNSRATVHRSGYMDYIGLMVFDDAGKLVGERRFLGLFTSSAYNRRPWHIPYIRNKVATVVERSGYSSVSHGGKALLHIMATLPRDELLQATSDELYELVIGVFDIQERKKTSLFVRADQFGRFFSCLVFIPRDRFKTEVREKIQGILKRSFKGESVDFTVQVAESHLARLHVIVRVKTGKTVEYDVAEIEAKLQEAVRSWHDRLRDILIEKFGQEDALAWGQRFGDAFPAAYIEDVTPWVAAFDVENLARLQNPDDIRMSLYRPRQRKAGIFRFKVFRCDQTIPLSDVLPMLENMGLRIVSERPYRLPVDRHSKFWIQDFDMQLAWGGDLDLERVRDNFQNAFERIVRGEMESDGFNRLILGAGLNWRQVVVIRAYCKYLLQTGVPFSQPYMEETLTRHPGIVRMMVELFEATFDPARDSETSSARDARLRALKADLTGYNNGDVPEWWDEFKRWQAESRTVAIDVCRVALRSLIETVNSLDEDRILRAFILTIRATLRTNVWQMAGKGVDYVSIKLDSSRVPDLPKPRPWREIFVYSPRVEGVHLRGGAVARGGLRWSDRREDFRTEVLGLMKAQMVKNTLIVPVGAKGGFVCKQLPDGDRDAVMAEVVSCYRSFISGLLDITDNLVENEIVHPSDVTRMDDPDPYLVVAADKGTATFSDIANSVVISQDFWMGDAFASGGSVGYDHKGMGITARGAWESVKRHFREMGVDCQAEPFTVVGIGDMAGDVFGNGMLLSRKIRLQAAFNHMHIFLDPDPDPETTFAERERLFKLPRSSWEDYDQSLISEGGGIFSRRDKVIPISPQIQAWLGIGEDKLAPNELIKTLLKAKVDLLWNGGIGTYVKASTETHADVGDRANDALRVNGSELGCKVVGEGGNLGLTQRGRIEYALAGGRLNTDFVDNSAGVDCSDHEVNIKILLNKVMADGQLDVEARNKLLAEMTDEVAELVLRNNYLQTQALSMMEVLAVGRLGSKAHFINALESQGLLDRELECLPSRDEIRDRHKRGVGLTRSELAVLLSYSKITLYQELLDSDVPEDPYLSRELVRYFPQPLQDRYADAMETHRLRREIIATVVTNSMVNRMGATFALRLQQDTGSAPSAVARAYSAAREIFNARAWWDSIEGHDNKVPSGEQTKAQLAIWNLLRHATRWILNHHRGDLNITNLVGRYEQGVGELVRGIAEWGGSDVSAIAERKATYLTAGFDSQLATELAGLPALNPALDIISVATRSKQPVERVSRIYHNLDGVLDLIWMMRQVEALPVTGQWHAHARGGLRDELYGHHRVLTRAVCEFRPEDDPESATSSWMDAHLEDIDVFRRMIADMQSEGAMDYATVSVAMRALDQLVSAVTQTS